MGLDLKDSARVALEAIAEAVGTLGHERERQGGDLMGVVWFLENEESPFKTLAAGLELCVDEIRVANEEALERARRRLRLIAAARARGGLETVVFEPERLEDGLSVPTRAENGAGLAPPREK